ncbi:MAG: cyclic lactone autoinducer peptide [Lachnospiraceae bacterium]|nr:cyclic lactone autoinducer peptide [Lachnospiraceae bacterium]
MKKITGSNSVKKVMGGVNRLAMSEVSKTANSACAWIYGQPKQPAEAKRMRKF